MQILEVLPVLVFIQITMCNHNFGSIWSFSQALIILHELISFIDSEKLVSSHSVAWSKFYKATVGVPHAVNAVSCFKASDLSPLHF